MKELEMELKLRNNLLKQRRVVLGLSAPQLAKRIGINYSSYVALENMRISPLDKRGKWRRIAVAVADFFYCEPDSLWPDVILAVKRSVVTKKVAASEVNTVALLRAAEPASYELQERLPGEASKLKTAFDQSFATLTKREQTILHMRFGIGEWEREHTLNEIADHIGISRERTRQLQERAFSKLYQTRKLHPWRPDQ